MAELLFGCSGEPLIICDDTGSVLRMNSYASSLLQVQHTSGVSLEQALGASKDVWDKALALAKGSNAQHQPSIQLSLRSQTHNVLVHSLGEPFYLVKLSLVKNQANLMASETGGEIPSQLIIRALEYQQMYLAEEKLAHTDALTGISNRRAFELSLTDKIKEYCVDQQVFSLVILDVDHFKSVNDTYGHQVGDLVLQQLAKLLKGKTRHFDSVYRIGGEEFALILADLPRDHAVETADRLRVIVEEARVADLLVTVSMGVVTCDRQEWTDIELVRAADEALYHSKQQGRNRVTHAEDLNSDTQAAS